MRLVAVFIISVFAVQVEGGLTKRSIGASCIMRQHLDGTPIGSVEFGASSDGKMVTFSVDLKSETINVGNHGFHIHQDPVSGNDCVTAGGHYNPNGKNHGSLYGSPSDLYERHVGDLGNVYAGEGAINVKIELKVGEWEAPFSLEGEQNIVGRSVVLHADEDDVGLGNFSDSLTTGHAGDRLACCTLDLIEGL